MDHRGDQRIMLDTIEEGLQYTAAIHDDELLTISPSREDSYQYHSNINNDETKYYDDLQEPSFQYHSNMFRVPSVSERMELAATINRIASFELSRSNQTNLGCFKALFQKLAREAIVSNHQLIFSGLDEISEHSVIYDRAQQEMLNLLYSIQENSKPNNHQQIVKLTI